MAGLRCAEAFGIGEFWIKNDEFCIKNDELCIKDDECCNENDEFPEAFDNRKGQLSKTWSQMERIDQVKLTSNEGMSSV